MIARAVVCKIVIRCGLQLSVARDRMLDSKVTLDDLRLLPEVMTVKNIT